MDRKISWTELWKAEPYRIQFLIQSVYDVVSSPTNLFSWGLKDTPACLLCQKRGSLEHILSCCPKALGEGRYRWCHDQVLRVIAGTISTGISLSKQQQPAQHVITFVKAEDDVDVEHCVIDSTLIQWHRIKEIIGSEPDSE